MKAMRLCAITCLLLLPGIGTLSAAEAPPKAADSERVLVKIGDDVITQSYFDVVYGEIPPQARPQWESPDGKRKLLTEIITVKLLAKGARSLNLDKDPAAAKRIQSAVEQALAREYQGYIMSQIKVSDEEAKVFWEQHKDRFKTPEEVHAGHIVVKTEAEAKEVTAELAKGRAFADVAKEKSFGPESENGGDLKWFRRGAMVKPLDEAVFKLKIDEVSAPIQTEFGYHILKLYERKPAVEKPYAEVQAQVRQAVLIQRAYEEMETSKKRLSLEYNVEVVNDPAQLPTKEEIRKQTEAAKAAQN